MGDKAAVGPKEHFCGGVAQDMGNPFRGLASCQHQGGGRVPGLVGPAVLQAQIFQQRCPDPFAEVLVTDRTTAQGREHPVDVGRDPLPLGQQGLADRFEHRDIPGGLVGLGPFLDLALHQGLADQDHVVVKVDSVPGQGIDFPRAESGPEAHGKVEPIRLRGGLDDLVDLLQRERLDIGLFLLEWLDAGIGPVVLEAISRLVQDHPQKAHDLVDPGRTQGIAVLGDDLAQLSPKAQNVGPLDGGHGLVAELRQQIGVDALDDRVLVGRPPGGRHLRDPGLGKGAEAWGVVKARITGIPVEAGRSRCVDLSETISHTASREAGAVVECPLRDLPLNLCQQLSKDLPIRDRVFQCCVLTTPNSPI